MNLIIFAWITTVSLIPLLFLPVLPAPPVLVFISVIALMLLQTDNAWLWAIAWSGLIFSWGVLVASQQLREVEQLTRRPLNAVVTVAATEISRKRIRVQIHQAEGRQRFPALSAWLTAGDTVTEFCPGQRWEMRLRLRPVHGQLNEGGYDQQRYALANYWPLQGKVLAKKPQNLSCSLRSRVINRAREEMSSVASQGVLQALLFGLRDNIPQRTNQLFRETGVAHLMAISGMHIGLAGSFGWWLARSMQKGLSERYISPQFPQVAGWLLAALYTWISGGLAPALRAMLALTLWMFIRNYRFNLNSWQVWISCAAGLLISDPVLILSDSFWLSMLAVLMLLIWYRWFSLPRYLSRPVRWFWLRLLHLQLGMMLLMLPLQALLFNGVSLAALPANMIAIPVVSLLTLPLAGIALLLTPTGLSPVFWMLADKSVVLMVTVLEAQPASWFPVSDFFLWATIAWGGLLFFRAGFGRYFSGSGGAVLLSCLLWRYSSAGEQWRADMLDVGHGLAIVISQGKEAVIYDTGNRWQQGDTGQRIIIPWLQQRQLMPQEVIISHRHLDHYGGQGSISNRWPAIPLRTALARPADLSCFRGEQWQWKKLTFSVLWPPQSRVSGQNDDSCVIRVSDGKFSLLLTGDLERRAERELVRLEKEQLRSTFIQVPHHGSNTSSAPVLLRRVNGQLAMASLARYNNWKMPSPAVIKRYRDAGFRWLDTAVSGQISLRIYKDSYQVLEMREQISRRWYHQWFGVKAESR